ncbi:MAG: serine/threonine-protein kinase PknK [Xanthomonadales bacterium]|nr:serine/threonine-protein kinase PknK [Xanthomonadales bacterium]
MQLAGYTVNDVIYALGETVVATATSANGERVVLKYLDSSRPSPEFSARWRHEYAVLRSIDSPFVIKARALEQVGRGAVLVLEAFAATNLAQLIARQTLDFSDKLTLAIRLTKALSAVHHHRLIHGDIAPKNVLVDAATLGLKLCDFGLSTRLNTEQRHAQDVFLRGTLDYMSPEQTGRTNLDIDYRSDFYSLGVSLYELFAGRKPFQSGDPITLLHAQIATVPTPLHELDAAIPQPVSALVQKLLAKHPDDRYQSSFGLLQDLEACAERWRLYRRIELSELGTADVPERFCVAQKLYGREAESSAILAAFDRVSVGAVELLLISGYSGIGKTALVSELHRPVVARRGYFVRGKCDQYSRNQPFAALIQAFQLLIRQIAVEGSERRQYWKTRLNEALQDNAAAVVEIIPELALLIGSPPSLAVLPAAESERRFHIAFAGFVKALAAHGHPLLVFLDDLQWADSQTLRLLEHLVRDDGECSALIVGAYRDNEVAAGDPLSLTIASIRSAQGRLEHLQLAPLGAREVQQLVADTLHCAPAEAAPLAALCLEKTQGNPFFLGQFLRNLNGKGDIRYVRKEGAWRWDLALIRQRSMTDNVVDLMLQKLAALEPATRALLALAAHLGDSFDHAQLMSVGERDAVATAEVLWPALQENLLVPLNEGYKFEHSPELLRTARYRFLHDRVQQAAHELTPASERPALRLHCGRLLLAACNEAELEERLFIILESLNAAIELMTDPAERARLLALNLRGGIRAKSSAAYTAAVELLRQGESLLPPDAWQQQPELALTVYKNLAEAEYLAGHFDVAEQRLVRLIAQAPAVAAKVTLCLALVELLHLRGRFADAFVVLCRALALLGRDFPESEEEAMQCYLAEFAETEATLAAQDEAALLTQSEMRDPERLLEMQVYYGLAYATYQINRGISYVLGACRMVKTTLAHGQCDLSCIAYVTYQTAMAASGRPYPAVHAMGRLARKLSEQRDNPYFRLSVYQYFGGFYQHWCEPLRETLPYLEQGMVMGRAGINPLAAGYCALLRSVNRFAIGLPLDELVAECEQGLAFLKRSHQPSHRSDVAPRGDAAGAGPARQDLERGEFRHRGMRREQLFFRCRECTTDRARFLQHGDGPPCLSVRRSRTMAGQFVATGDDRPVPAGQSVDGGGQLLYGTRVAAPGVCRCRHAGVELAARRGPASSLPGLGRSLPGEFSPQGLADCRGIGPRAGRRSCRDGAVRAGHRCRRGVRHRPLRSPVQRALCPVLAVATSATVGQQLHPRSLLPLSTLGRECKVPPDRGTLATGSVPFDRIALFRIRSRQQFPSRLRADRLPRSPVPAQGQPVAVAGNPLGVATRKDARRVARKCRRGDGRDCPRR